MLASVVRELGLSDTAAAGRLGLAASTLSRWKREQPEVRTTLLRAREECRSLQLQRVMASAAAEHGRGWRAAAWLLERLYPEDYSPSAAQRERFQHLAERRAEREEAAALEAELEEATRQSIAAKFGVFAEEEAPAETAAPPVSEAQTARPLSPGGTEKAHRPAREDECLTSEDDCRNCRNSVALEGTRHAEEVSAGEREKGRNFPTAQHEPSAQSVAGRAPARDAATESRGC